MLVGLCSNPGSLISKGYLIQIWIAVEAGSVFLAKDSLYDIVANEAAFSSQLLQNYREESTKIQIPYDDMTNSDFLQYEVAERCGIQGSKLLPVFRLDSPDFCVAVIELVTVAPDTDFGIKDFSEIERELEKVGLKISNNVEYSFAAVGQEVQSNSDSQFYDGSCSSDDETPIVSARLKDPRMIRIFRFKPLFTIEGLKRAVRNQFKWDDNTGTKFDLHSVNKQNERVALMDRDEHVRELFGTHSVVFVIDVQLHEDARHSKRNKRGHGRDTRHGVELNINGDGYKMAYEAVARKLKPGKRDKMLQNIIDASPSKVKALRIKYCSPPSPPDLDGRHKKMRRGESSSSSTLETQHYSGGPSNMVSVQGKTQDILMSADTTTEQVQVQPVISVEQQVPHNYVVPPVSASHMEEDPSSMELLVSEGKGTAEETAHGAVCALQMEENECTADDFRVGLGVDNQLVFYDEKGREIDASGHDHDIYSSVELNAPTVVVESIDPEQHVQPSELDSEITRNMEVIIMEKNRAEQEVPHNYVVPVVSASQMEEKVNPRNMELLVSAGKTQYIMSAETSEEQVQPTTELNYGIATNVDFDGNAVGDMELSISDFPLSPLGFLGLLNTDGDFSLPNDNFGWSDSGDYDDFDMINRGFLQYEVAERCGIHGSKLVPVFRLDSPDSCVAVIELVTAAPNTEFGIKDLNEMKRGLEKLGLTTPDNVEYLFATQQEAGQGLQDKPYSLVRSSWKGKEVLSNSDSQFCVGSPSSDDDKTPIVSARLKIPRMVRIFRFKPPFTIEGLKRAVRNQFKWDDNAGIEFDLHSVNNQSERVGLIDNDNDVMELFSTHSVVFVIDVQLHNGALSSKRNKRGRDGDTRHGVVLDINGDGFKMAYEAVDREFTPSERDKMMQNIIAASPSKVKALRIQYCSPPSPPDLDERHKKMRRGESSSSSTLETQHYSGGPSNMVSVQGKTQDILMSAETTTEQVQVQPVISVEQQVPRNYMVPPVSASQMEEDPSNMELLVSKGKGRAEETAQGAVSASQMEGNECPADDLRVGFRVDDQLAFYDEKGREIDASGHDHDISSSVELNAPTVVVESIDPEQHVQLSELDSGIARNMEVISVQKSTAKETTHGALHNYVVPVVSASQTEEKVNPRNMELLVSAGKTQYIMSAETSEEQVQPTTELNYGIATNVDFDGNAVGDMELSISDFPLSPLGFLGLLNTDGDFSLPNDNFGWSDSGDYDDFDLARTLDEIH